MPHHDHHHHHHGGAPPPQPQPPPPKPNTKLLSLILKAIIMTLITSFFFLLLGLASLVLLPLLLATHHHHHHQQPNPSNGFSPKHLKKLPQFRYVKGTTTTTIKANPETEECVVCLDGFKGGQWCRKLVGCGHVFHRKCVDTWLIKVSACPICRTRVMLDLEEDRNFWVFGRRSNHFRV